MAKILQTARLTLRPMEINDAKALHEFFSDPVAMEYWSQPHKSFQETKDWVRGTVDADPKQTLEYALLLDDEVIGKAGLWKSPELGYFLIREHWGHGYMHEARRALVPHLHQEMAEVITAEVTPGNHRSLTLLADLGFQQTRHGIKDYWDGQKWCDTLYLERAHEDPLSKQ